MFRICRLLSPITILCYSENMETDTFPEPLGAICMAQPEYTRQNG